MSEQVFPVSFSVAAIEGLVWRLCPSHPCSITPAAPFASRISPIYFLNLAQLCFPHASKAWEMVLCDLGLGPAMIPLS